MSEVKAVNRIAPAQIFHPRWETEYSEYPEVLRVVMQNGHVKTYRLEFDQPRPQCMKSAEIIRMMNENVSGYRPKHEKK